MKDEVELTAEKTEELASFITTLNITVRFIDVDYAMAAASKLRTLANEYDSWAALNHCFNPIKSKLYNKQAESIECLCSYVRALKECDKIKQDVSTYDNSLQKFTHLFI